jgi:hypothetical protein
MMMVEPALPRSVDEHPEIAAHKRHRQELAAALKDGRGRISELTAQRSALAAERIARLAAGNTPIALVNTDDVAALEREIRSVDARAQELQAALQKADVDGRELAKRVRAELREVASREIREVLLEAWPHIDALAALSARLADIHKLGVTATPLVLGAFVACANRLEGTTAGNDAVVEALR